jgi:hypothetical protein
VLDPKKDAAPRIFTEHSFRKNYEEVVANSEELTLAAETDRQARLKLLERLK